MAGMGIGGVGLLLFLDTWSKPRVFIYKSPKKMFEYYKAESPLCSVIANVTSLKAEVDELTP